MPVKHVAHPKTGKLVFFGRRRPVAEYPCLRIKNYTLKSLPKPPDSVDYSARAMPALDRMYKNDVLGCCVVSAKAHAVGVFTGNAGTPPVEFTDDQIVNLYSAIGGYVPGDSSTDNGCDMQTALAYQRKRGLMPGHPPHAKHRIAGWMAVDAANAEELKTALWLFEDLDIGMELPDEWITPFPSSSGFTWDTQGQPDPENGHNVPGLGYNSLGVPISTWGMIGTMTWAAIAKYAAISANGELYTVLSQDSINKATLKAPNGFDFSQLQADLEAIGTV